VESLPESLDHALVTLVWRDESVGARNIQAFFGLNLGSPRSLIRVPNTDVWYYATVIRNDSRFTYAFIVSASNLVAPMDATPSESPLSSLRRDPRNPNVHCGYSVAELPRAAPQRWMARSAPHRCGTLDSVALYSDFQQENGLSRFTLRIALVGQYAT
jgi:hypothetical protein